MGFLWGQCPLITRMNQPTYDSWVVHHQVEPYEFYSNLPTGCVTWPDMTQTDHPRRRCCFINIHPLVNCRSPQTSRLRNPTIVKYHTPGWWFGCHFLFSHIGLLIIPMTNSYFSEGWPNHQPDPDLKKQNDLTKTNQPCLGFHVKLVVLVNPSWLKGWPHSNPKSMEKNATIDQQFWSFTATIFDGATNIQHCLTIFSSSISININYTGYALL